MNRTKTNRESLEGKMDLNVWVHLNGCISSLKKQFSIGLLNYITKKLVSYCELLNCFV